MAQRTVKVALWRYRDEDGTRRIAHFGEKVNLPDDEIERGEAQNVFKPAPVPAVVTAALEKAHASIESRVPEPPEQIEAALHHDITAAAEPVVDEPAAADVLAADDAVTAAADSGAVAAVVADAEGLKRPAKTAHVDAWRDYVVAATAKSDSPISAETAAAMTTKELQAAVPLKDG